MTSHRRLLAVMAAVGAAVALSATASTASPAADSFGGRNTFRESLSGYQEDPLVLSTTGGGQFRASINDRTMEISYQLSYSGLAGNVTQSHIHFGGRSQSGGISVFLCTNLGNGPAGTQACPAAPATISGTIKATDIIGPTGQGIAAGEFAELTKAMRAGVTYVNVHSATFPGGEIRAQLDHH
ncbi:CHRD domain-containing protein [Actinocrispum sp. NPDC049592]|uniref:CHRD domain-containing protein n=1 Tax=Actinocrispum sp. NPDC049592 TaxID=3154835 RepID=UPI003419D57D